MRRDHRPYWLKKIYLRCTQRYIQHFIAPKLEHLGQHANIMKPRHLMLSGSGISMGEFTTIACEHDQNVRIATWPLQQHSVQITIGSYCMISPGVRISALKSITIGDNCMFANGVYITDSDWHGVYNRVDLNDTYKAITIGNNVWIGDRATVLKGVCIGDNSIIAAGSIVTKSIPANVIAAGNPATVVRQLEPQQELVTRQAMFSSARYFEEQEYIERHSLAGNSLWTWLRTLLFPKRGD